jgi:hypothetical protein
VFFLGKTNSWKIAVVKEGKIVAKKSGIDFDTALTVLDILDDLFKANNPTKIFTEVVAEPKKN